VFSTYTSLNLPSNHLDVPQNEAASYFHVA
jgi:hypothetical protein